ncbi:MAG: allantoinase AllB [Jiangellaceae bacterium]
MVTATGEIAASVGVQGGRIATIEPLAAALTADLVVDIDDDAVLLPGLVDTHVHVNEPGRTEWEGFASATAAAAAGGVTTVIDMPLNSIPATVDVDALAAKRDAAAGQCHVDVGFWGGAVPANRTSLRALYEAGVFGFKCFLSPSGVEEFPPLSYVELREHLRILSDIGVPMLVHAEDPEVLSQASAAGGRHYADFLHSRPPEAENLAIARIVEAARSARARTHIVHLSSADALATIRRARDGGVAVTAETCPHYLCFTAEEVPDGATVFKCCPPIREAANRELLWAGVADGTVGAVVSDHSPCTPELKLLDDGDFCLAWGGIASVQVGLPAVWTEARRRGFMLSDVVRWMAEGPATLAGLRRKGRIEVGRDADLCAFAPDEPFVVDPAALRHRNPLTPYTGRSLTGVVRSTWLRGAPVDGEIPNGGLITRGAA